MKVSVQLVILCLLVTLPLGLYAQKEKQANLTREQYIEKYKDLAIGEMKAYGIPASITLAQACLESNNGNSRLAVEANNHFGIKCHDSWDGKTITEDDDAKGECFRSYAHAKQSYEDHSYFLRYRKRYQSLFELDSKDYKAWATGLKTAGYATNPRYAESLVKIIEDYKLYLYDSEISESEVASKVPRPSKVDIIDVDKFVVMLGREVYERNGVSFVVAKKHDTYYRIADEMRITTNELFEYNDLGEKSKIKEGDVIYIEPKRKKADKYHPVHIAEAGETMQSISQLYAIKLKELYKKNKMSMKDEQQPVEGQELFLRKAIKKQVAIPAPENAVAK